MKILPVAVFLRLVVVAVFTMGSILSSQAAGKVAAWGENDYGQCLLPNGLNSVKAIAAGTQHGLALKADGTVVGWGYNSQRQASQPAGLSGVIAIAAGGGHSLALCANGSVVTWGSNGNGLTNLPPGLNGAARAIAAGGSHSLVLKTDGTVVAWGWNYYGQTNVPAGLSNVIAISASSSHSLALKSDGTVVAWGYNAAGQTNVPTDLSNVTAIAAGAYRNLALRADGTVVAWGDSYAGRTNVPAGLSNVIAIAAGYYQNLALKSDGTIVSWGERTNVPPGLAGVTAVAMGERHALAIVPDGPPEILEQPADLGAAFQSNVVLSVVARGFEPLNYRWYFNGYPLADSVRIAGATNATLTISNAQFSDLGSYSVVVSNGLGVVQSTGAMLTVISPPIITLQPVGRTVLAGTNITLTAAATGTPPLSYRWLFNGTPLMGATGTSLSLSNVQSILSGNYSLLVSNVYGVTESSNALVTVLESAPYILTQPTNRVGVVGGTASFAVNARGSTPLSYQWLFEGVAIPGGTNTTLILTSLRYEQAGLYTVAISNAFSVTISAKAQLSVSQVAVWGSSGGLTNVPPGLTNIIAVSAGESHLLALRSDGTVAAWGYGRLLYPIPFPGFSTPATNVPAGLNGVIKIAAGANHSLALRSNGTVVAWGDNSYSQTNVPAGLSNVISIAAGDVHSLALKADGKVMAWGARSVGFPVPTYIALTNVPPGLSNVVAIAAGYDRNLALKSDGKVVAWGLSNTTNVPTSLSNVIAIACGEAIAPVRPAPSVASTFNLALRADGTVVSWSAATSTQPPFPGTTPLLPPSGLSNVVAIAAGGHGMALKADGSVVTWGLTNPPPPQGLSNTIAIAAGYNFAAAVKGDGSPFFTLQPVGQTVARGTKVQFHARAVGVQPLTYQWQLDGANLPGAISPDLVITNIAGDDTGDYRVIASNPLGSTTSAVAKLTIPFSTNLAAALNATNLVWTTTPTNTPWFAQIRTTHDGDVAAQSGRASHNQQSTLQATVVGPGTLTFWWKASSEQGYDRLWFSMDYQNWATWISGETDWQQFTFPIPPGSHVLNWAYTKDGTVTAGQDAGWLDQVTFTPAAPLTSSAPRRLADGSFAFWSVDSGGRQLLPMNLASIEIQASTNLWDWVALPGVCTLTNGSLLIRDLSCTNFPHRFYRVIEH